jgi:hypothetical protein
MLLRNILFEAGAREVLFHTHSLGSNGSQLKLNLVEIPEGSTVGDFFAGGGTSTPFYYSTIEKLILYPNVILSLSSLDYRYYSFNPENRFPVYRNLYNMEEQVIDNGIWMYHFLTEDSVEIIGVSPSFKGDALEIPVKLDGINVTKLASGFMQHLFDINVVTFESGSMISVIESNTFKDTSLETIVLPSSIKEIKINAFYNSMLLRNILFEAGAREVLFHTHSLGSNGSQLKLNIVEIPEGSTVGDFFAGGGTSTPFYYSTIEQLILYPNVILSLSSLDYRYYSFNPENRFPVYRNLYKMEEN